MAWMTWWALWTGVVAAPVPQSAASTVELRWQAPPSCPTSTEVATRIATRLADGTAIVEDSAGTHAMVVDFVVAVEQDGHAAELVITTGSGRTIRRLQAATCETVVDAAVLIVAMVHAQSQPVALPEPEPTPAPVAASPRASEPAKEPAPAPAKRRAPLVRGSAFAEIAVGFAGLPRVGPGLGGGLALLRPMARGMLRAEVLGHFWFAREAAIGPAAAEARVDVRLWTVGAHVGPLWRAGPVELGVLVGGHAGLAHGHGDRVPIARSARRPWVAVGAYPTLLWPLHRQVALGLRGTVEGVVYRPKFTVREGGRSFVASPVTGALAAIVEVRFP